jgi:pimeloyl-ACP methyl ester carboxylesterase
MTFSFDEFANPDPSLMGYAPFGAYETWYSVTGSLESSLTPIIVIHGGPGSTHHYVTPLRQIALGGYPVIHYDQVGCGFSSQLGEAEILGGGHVTWADALTPYLAAVMSFLGALDGERA